VSNSKSVKTILVTGGCGYIGSHVVRQLHEKGYQVVVIDNLSTGFRAALLNNEKLYVADVGDEAALEKVFTDQKIDAVMHFAAALIVPESVENPVKYYRNNTFNTLKLFDAVARHKVPHVIFSSTAATYGQQKSMPVFEDGPTGPESPYGASKLMSERMLADLAFASRFSFAILRYFNVAGADPEGRLGQRTPEATHLIKVAVETATGKRPSMKIFGTDYPTRDGTCIRDYIHVEDLASAHLLALDYLQKGGSSDIFNCGYGQGSTVQEVVDTVKKVSGVNFKVDLAPRRPGDVAEVVAGADKIRKKLGWQPRFDQLETIVRHAWNWERSLS
jgi:UDP-glucose 4-epimerase